MANPRPRKRTIRAWAVVSRRGKVQDFAYPSNVEEMRTKAHAELAADWWDANTTEGPHTVVPLVGVWEKGKGKR